MATNDAFSTPGNSRHSFYDWQSDYESALAETDIVTGFKLVEIAEAAMLTRRSSLQGSPGHHAERQALEEALSNLRILKRDRLKFGA